MSVIVGILKESLVYLEDITVKCMVLYVLLAVVVAAFPIPPQVCPRLFLILQFCHFWPQQLSRVAANGKPILQMFPPSIGDVADCNVTFA